jgi:hypothetical protein
VSSHQSSKRLQQRFERNRQPNMFDLKVQPDIHIEMSEPRTRDWVACNCQFFTALKARISTLSCLRLFSLCASGFEFRVRHHHSLVGLLSFTARHARGHATAVVCSGARPSAPSQFGIIFKFFADCCSASSISFETDSELTHVELKPFSSCYSLK